MTEPAPRAARWVADRAAESAHQDGAFWRSPDYHEAMTMHPMSERPADEEVVGTEEEGDAYLGHLDRERGTSGETEEQRLARESEEYWEQSIAYEASAEEEDDEYVAEP